VPRCTPHSFLTRLHITFGRIPVSSQMSEGGGRVGSLARRTFEATIPNEESTCLGYLRIIRSRSYADARGRRRVPSPAAVRTVALFQTEWTSLRTRAGIHASENRSQARSLRHEDTSTRIGLLQYETRTLRTVRAGFFSGVFVFRADGPSVLGLLFGGVEA
jgi:hypothetical protein